MISIGVEYACPKMLKEMKKPSTVQDDIDAFKKIRKAKITPKAYMMVGYPGETREDFEESLKMTCRLNVPFIFLSMDPILLKSESRIPEGVRPPLAIFSLSSWAVSE